VKRTKKGTLLFAGLKMHKTNGFAIQGIGTTRKRKGFTFLDKQNRTWQVVKIRRPVVEWFARIDRHTGTL
jgi:hypothetical protein